MAINQGKCPMTAQSLIDTYFIESRTKLLDIAAFLDRLDRAASGERDFRVEALERALHVLCENESGRVEQIQMIFSDTTETPRAHAAGKSACGAFNPND